MIKKIRKTLKNILNDKDEKSLIDNIIAAFIIRGASLFISTFSMPLYIRYFDNNNLLGIWYTILSILSWISICDLGLGSGLRNYFTIAYTQNNISLGKKYLISTYISMIGIIAPILVIGSIVFCFIDLNSFLNIPADLLDSNVLRGSIIILFVGLGVNFVLKSISSVIYAIQKSSINNFISLISSALPLIYIVVAPSGNLSENFLKLSIVHIISVNLPLIIATIVVFKTKCKNYVPKLKDFDFLTAKSMLKIGLSFFFAQIFFMILISANEVFITKMFGPEYVVEYSAYYKVFMLVGSLFMVALTPIWSKVTRDLTEHKYYKIKVTNRVLYCLSLVAFILEIFIAFVIQYIFDIWLQESSISVNVITSLIFALFGGLYIFNIVLTTVANGIGELRSQTIIYGIGAILKVPVSIALKTIYNDWNIIIAYNCVILLVFCIVQFVWVEKKINKLLMLKEGD